MGARKKVLILGAKGMLGQELARVYREDEGYEVAAWESGDVDVTDFELAERKIRDFAPELIINAVAYNAVDACEGDDAEYEKAVQLNAEVPAFLARLGKEMETAFIHYSTDYVFDGESESGYTEDATPRPLSRYGTSKWQGEKNVMKADGKYYVIRLSKLFGKPSLSANGKKSFFEKMIDASRGTSEVVAVDDERSCFTYAPDLALASKVLEQGGAPYGIYHLINEGAATWYEATRELFRILESDIAVKPVSADAFPRPAKRPKYSMLRNTKFLPLRPYTEALEEFLGSTPRAKR